MELLLNLIILSGLLCLNTSVETECVFNMPVKQQLRCLKYLGTRICYYTNSSASFQINILIYGDINPNPGPATLENKIVPTTVHVKLDTL